MREALQRIPGVALHDNRPLAEVCTFRLGGPCPLRVDCAGPEALVAAAGILREAKQPFVLLGGGSNILVSDHGVESVVLRYAAGDIRVRRAEGRIEADAGSSLDALAAASVDAGLEGLNCCSGIPGTVGGAVAGNAGAWGRQVSDTLEWVEVLGADGAVRRLSPAELGFAYRSSRLQGSGDTVLRAGFCLAPGEVDALQAERASILALRAEKHPHLDSEPCIGSFFRNIEPSSKAERRQAAGWFLEEAGAKAMREGGAAVFERHANIIVARAGCTAQNVYDLHLRMAAAVREKFGFDLVREIRLLGRFEGGPAPAPAGYY